MKTALIINAHQKWEKMSEGKLNEFFEQSIIDYLVGKNIKVITTKIATGYKVNEEIEKHEVADLVITQTPVFWFNTPWIHKKYIDEVFTEALMHQKIVVSDGRQLGDRSKQYGTGGVSQGKKYMLSATWNAPKTAFSDNDQILFKGKTADEVLHNLSAVYKFSGFEILNGFHSYDVLKNPDIENDTKRLVNHMGQLF
ncbi:flavodoxin family protein [Flagellimonas lutimaris]|uniref:Flavodoxin family protein n=1 Tax=Flagellimonas lutimaris TaxID=475082 RepID=A0A3A1NB08_9FLAO|nr:NAD(P)H-dependent oxidoreductase [Allomuricauda lutimaris]RIV36685.1 flavodoxin family protein [Allomuricauda lutimaris]